jgi:hypothetical protein
MNAHSCRTSWITALAVGAIALCLSIVFPGRDAIAQTLPVAGNPGQAAIIDQAELRAQDQRDDAAQRAANEKRQLYSRGGMPAAGRPRGNPPISARTTGTAATGTGLGGSLAGTAGAAGFGPGLPGSAAGGAGGAGFNNGGASSGNSGAGIRVAGRTPYSTVPPAGAAAGAATQTALPPPVGTGGAGLGVGGLRGSGVGATAGTVMGSGRDTTSGVGAVGPALGGVGARTSQPGTTSGGIGLGPTSAPPGGLGSSLSGAPGGMSGNSGPTATTGAGGGATTGSAGSGGATTSGLGGSGSGAGAGGT